MMQAPVGKEYLPFQCEGIAWAQDKDVFLIADEMGLGKTIQAIGYLNEHPGLREILVVCPASLVINWENELGKWKFRSNQRVKVTNYEQLHKLKKKNYDAVILDEIQYIKNPETKRAKECMKLVSPVRIGLTGTPVLTRIMDLFGILCWLRPEKFNKKTRRAFSIRYAGGHVETIQFWVKGVERPRKITKRVWMENQATNLDEIVFKMGKIMLRREKRDVMKDLPAKIRQVIEIPADGDIMEELGDKEARIEYSRGLMDLDDVITAGWTEMASLRHQVGLEKARRALPFLEDCIEASGKLVIFCHHRDVMEYLAEKLGTWGVEMLHGGHSKDHRDSAVSRFQNNPLAHVILVQTQAGGVGITLTAASHVIVLEFDWSPGVMSQAEDRCHRIGQKDSVLVQYLALGKSLDARMAHILVRKQNIIDRVVSTRKG